MASTEHRFDDTTLGGGPTKSGSTGDTTTRALTILFHPDLERIGDRAALGGLSVGETVHLSRSEPTFVRHGHEGGAPLADEHLSRRPLLITPSDSGSVRLSIGDSSTVVTFRGERVHTAISFTEAQIRRGVVLDLAHRIVLLLHSITASWGLPAVDVSQTGREIVGESDGLRRMLWDVQSVADLSLPVLVRGETGTGKELVANAIHRRSARRDRPFVPVNLGAIPSPLAVAELFGADRGGFTGAVSRKGYFEQADGGTLFLDEIGEAPVELQAALLRVLEGGELQVIGAQRGRKVDVRVIAATDANLEEKVASGAFRAPLLNRLSAYEIWIPPLRERRDDIGRILAMFLREELQNTGQMSRLESPAPGNRPWFPSSLAAQLCDHDWPGNVRQLHNVVRQLVVGNRGRDRVVMTPAVARLLAEPLKESTLPSEREVPPPTEPPPTTEPIPQPYSSHDASPPASPMPAAPSTRTGPRRTGKRKPAEVTETELGHTLRLCRWDFAAAADQLGVSRASIYVLIKRYPQFRVASDLSAEEIIRCHQESRGDIAKMADRLEVSERALARRVRELGLS